MVCEKCGQEFNSNFCPNCGTPARSGLDLFDDSEMFDSIESSILSDADAEYNRELGSVVSRSGGQDIVYSNEEADYEDSYDDGPDYGDGYDDDGYDDYDQGYDERYDDDYDDEEDYRSGGRRKKKEKKKKGSDIPKPDLSKSGKQIKKGVSNATAAAGRGVRTAFHAIFRIMKWASGFLMLATAVQLLKGFWAERSTLGSMTGFIYEKNYPEEAYLIGAACVILFAIIQFFWIMSSQRAMRLGMVQRIDTGRGIFGFAVYIALAVTSGIIVHIIPSSPSVLTGVRLVFSVIGNLPRTFLLTNVIGIILCFLRKLNRMM